MASPDYAVSALLTGAMLVALVLFIARVGGWRRYSPPNRRERVNHFENAAASPTTWTVAFVLGCLVAGGGAVLLVSGGIPAVLRQSARVSMLALLVVSAGGFVFWGTYQSARHRGTGNALATLAGLWACGVLFLVAVVARLVTA